MIRNLKALGLAMAAVVVFGAVYTPAASSQQGELTSDGPVTLTGTEIPVSEGGVNRLTAFGASFECPGTTYLGHRWQSTPHAFLKPAGETASTLTPIYNETNEGGALNCKVLIAGWTATIHMNGCDYVAHIGETVENKENTYDVTLDIDCPIGHEITVTFWTGSANHTAERNCMLHIPEQFNLQGAHVSDTTEGDIVLEGRVEGIALTRTGTKHGGLFCPKNSVTTTHTASLDFDVTIVGHNEDGGPTDIGLSHS